MKNLTPAGALPPWARALPEYAVYRSRRESYRAALVAHFATNPEAPEIRTTLRALQQAQDALFDRIDETVQPAGRFLAAVRRLTGLVRRRR